MLEAPGTGERAETLPSLDAAWAALDRGDWAEARAQFASAVAVHETAETLEGLSWAAWWQNDADALFDARERAYQRYREAGDPLGAARMASWLGTDHVDFRGELRVARGWLGRARRLLDGLEPCEEHGWLWVHEGEKQLLVNDTEQARESGARAAELGRALAIVDLEMLGMTIEGLALVTEGAVDEGMSRLDEAAAAALGGEFARLWAVAWCGCIMLHACDLARDYDRATEWCRQMEEWSARMNVVFINRVCRAHYAHLLIWHGTWSRAEELLEESARGLAIVRPVYTSEATVRLGELRRRQGRLDEAVALFEEAADHRLALLGLGEACLDRDDPAGARDRSEQYLRETPPQAGALRAPGLELLLRALVRLGAREEAEACQRELDAIATRIGTEPLHGSARFAAGVLAAVAGEHELARVAFEDAIRHFQRSDAPFEAARARAEVARTLVQLGRRDDALREAEAGEAALRRIGAVQEAERAGSLVSQLRARPDSPLTRREREVLRLVADGKSDRAIARELVLSEHTIHRHVANILTKLDAPTRSAAVAEALRRDLL